MKKGKQNDLEMGEIQGQQQPLLQEGSNYDIRRSAHPFACIFHILFKGLAFFAYLFLGLFVSNPVIQYIVVVLCDAFDFWTVKNITGRLLVGLRWWSTFTPKGKEIWKFESMVSKNSAVDSTIFWTFQFGSTVAWGVFAGLNIMTFSITDFVLAFIGFSLSALNLWGYYKCSKDQQKQMKQMKHFFATKGLQMAMKR